MSFNEENDFQLPEFEDNALKSEENEYATENKVCDICGELFYFWQIVKMYDGIDCCECCDKCYKISNLQRYIKKVLTNSHKYAIITIILGSLIIIYSAYKLFFK